MKMRESTLRKVVRSIVLEYGGMSPSMRMTKDPEFHLKRALKKWNMSDQLDQVLEIWNYMSPSGPKSLHRMYLETFEGEPDPGPEAITDIFNALRKDQKRCDSRGSYSF